MAADTANADQYNGGALLVTVVVFQALTWISVVLRTYVRAILTKSFQIDDWLMLVAQINFTLSCAFIALGLTAGLGHHNAVLPQPQEILAIKWQALATGTYISNMMFIKLSIGVFLLRLATQRRYKWIIWVSMGIVASMSSVLFLWDIFQCKPVAAQWDYTIPGYTCVTTLQVIEAAYALSALSIVSDWLYALLPIPMLWNAKMTPQAKATVSVVLGLGIFASVATLIRVKFLADLADADDILYAGTEPMVWTLVEPGVAIVASSLVTIRPLLRQMRLKGFESSQSSGGRRYGFWNRYGRYGQSDRASKLEGENPSSKRSRTANGMDAFEQDAVRLKDIEAGHGTFIAETTTKKTKGYSSRETTLTSQSSVIREQAVRQQSVRNFSNPLHVLVRQNDSAKAAGGGGIGHDDDEPPLSPWLRMCTQAKDSENAFVGAQGQGSTLRGHVKNGKTMWRSEAPNSPEEAEAIQGLRELSSRAGKGNSPFS